MSNGVAAGTRRWRVGLGDLGLVVLAVALTVALVRGVKEILVDMPSAIFLLVSSSARPTAPPGTLVAQVDPFRVFGIGLVGMGVLILLMLGMSAYRSRANLPAALWRILAMALVGAFLSRMSDLLEQAGDPSSRFVGLSIGQVDLNLKVVSICFACALTGILLCLRPARPKRSTLVKARWLAWLPALLAGIVGLVLVTGCVGDIVFLVMLALDAVWKALRHPAEIMQAKVKGGAGDWLFADPLGVVERMKRVAIVGTSTLIACALTSGWLAVDLRSSERRGSIAGRAYRVGTFLACALGGAWLYLRGIRFVHPNLADGLIATAWPIAATAILGGFGVLALGMSASGSVETPALEPPSPVEPPMSRCSLLDQRFGVFCILAGAVLISSNWFWPNALARGVREQTLELLRWVLEPDSAPGLTTTSPLYRYLSLFRLESLGLWGILGWQALTILRIFRQPQACATLDQILSAPSATFRFVGRGVALATVMFTLFPAFVFTSLGLIEVLIFMID